jgi:hypothetical protein
MDDFEIISLGRLTQVRFATIRAQRANAKGAGGALLVNSTSSVTRSKDEPNKAIAKLILDLRGIPKDAAEDTDDIDFRIELEIRGVYRWPSEVAVESFERQDITSLLCQPLFLNAARKAESLVSDLGIYGAKLDTDLRTIADEALAATERNASKSVPNRPRKKASVKKLPRTKLTK